MVFILATNNESNRDHSKMKKTSVKIHFTSEKMSQKKKRKVQAKKFSKKTPVYKNCFFVLEQFIKSDG